MRDNARAIVIAPMWTCQPWLALLKRLAVESLVFPKDPGNLTVQGQLNTSQDGEEVKTTKLMAFPFWPIH